MFLSSITLRGFKSFADKTVLDLEPGVTVIVGPNGSGKSNIVDALTWVLGTHSAKTLRGGSMADVIYAGAPGRAALGRAMVEITIDNSSGSLPIEFSEVSVSRSVFATGETSYRINEVDCRALDVQELLSDTGLGRQTHTIVGQGQLDAVLGVRPEERRLFIEEAAGILKHRRRKERALRKLSQMESHLERLTDLLRELRRGLRPLERQAEAAAKAAQLQAAVYEVRVARALRELAAANAAVASDEVARAASGELLADLGRQLSEAREREGAIEERLDRLAPAARAATETHFRLANLTERYRGLVDRIAERHRGLRDAVEEPVAGRDPHRLRDDASAARQALKDVEIHLVQVRARLEAASQARREAERAQRAHQQAAVAEARRRVEDRERRLRWEGEVTALRGQVAQAANEDGRLMSQISGQTSRREELLRDIDAVQAEIQRLDGDTGRLERQLEAASRLEERRQQAVREAAKRERDLERQRASLEARADTLTAAARDPSESAAALLEAARRSGSDGLDGLLGRLMDHITVPHGQAAAVSAALGALGLDDALVATGRDTAIAAIGLVRSQELGWVAVLAADASPPAVPTELAEDSARPLAGVLDAEPPVRGMLSRALAGTFLVEDFSTACRLAATHPDLVFVSNDGDIAGARGYAGGGQSGTPPVLALAAAAEARRQAEAVASALLVAGRQVGDADRALTAARHELDAATAAMQESDGLITAGAERLRRLRKELAHAESSLAKLQSQRADLRREVDERLKRLDALEQLNLAPHDLQVDVPDLEAELLEDALSASREREVQARIEVNATNARAEELTSRIEASEREAAEVEQQLAELLQRRQARLEAIERLQQLAGLAEAALRQAQRSTAASLEQRDEREQRRAREQEELGAVRARARELQAGVEALAEQRHREELASQELRHRLDAVRARLSQELGLDPDTALLQAGSADLEPGPERDQALADREDRLASKLALLGTVNPLAVEEYEELRERHGFLTEQLEDCRSSKRDLMEVVEAVDERVCELFASAFADVAAQFERLFPRLFPGGEGRLFLTDPDDLLETGVEVEARPPGKRVKRLSLLSGGERSLCALAVLFAIFAARPSPFYVLDEVEAALDDVNLQRFLDVVRDFDHSQLLIVTHQKRTMEIADVLYGVTMRAGGVSKVISQRVAELIPV
ncbi:MAG: chromosome segregation protein SMC [Egibacteraceae bacterium]